MRKWTRYGCFMWHVETCADIKRQGEAMCTTLSARVEGRNLLLHVNALTIRNQSLQSGWWAHAQ